MFYTHESLTGTSLPPHFFRYDQGMKHLIFIFVLSLTAGCQEKGHGKKKNYSSEVRSAIYVDDEHIEFLEDASTADGYACELNVRKGDIYDYNIQAETLTLTKDQETILLDRIEGEKDNLVGTWASTKEMKTLRSDLQIVFESHYDISIVEKCRYKK